MEIGNKYYTRDKSYWYLVERIKDDKAFCKTSTGYFMWIKLEDLEELYDRQRTDNSGRHGCGWL